MIRACLLLFISIFSFSCTSPTSNQDLTENFTAKVIGIKDGDTIEILFNGVPLTVRLEHIDCPEKKQPFGNEAKQFTSDFIFGQIAQIKWNNKKDRWGRLIAEVFNKNDENLNKALVSHGLGMHYKKYSSDVTYDELEKAARKNEIGMWSEPNVIEPWIYRKTKHR